MADGTVDRTADGSTFAKSSTSAGPSTFAGLTVDRTVDGTADRSADKEGKSMQLPFYRSNLMAAIQAETPVPDIGSDTIHCGRVRLRRTLNKLRRGERKAAFGFRGSPTFSVECAVFAR